MPRLGHVLLALGCVALVLGTLATAAVAQVAEDQTAPPGPRRPLQEAVAAAVAQTPPAPGRKQSAKRGAIRGALIGAGVAAGASVELLVARYSWRNATRGSTREARYAGSHVATSATRPSAAIAMPNVTGSAGERP